MSRSYRLPIRKDGGHKGKQIHARRLRSRCRRITRVFLKDHDEFALIYGAFFLDEEDFGIPLSWSPEPLYPHRWEVTERWNICDWKTWYRVRRWADGFEWFGDPYHTSPEDVKKESRK